MKNHAQFLVRMPMLTAGEVEGVEVGGHTFGLIHDAPKREGLNHATAHGLRQVHGIRPGLGVTVEALRQHVFRGLSIMVVPSRGTRLWTREPA